MEFLEAQSTTIKKRERSACETKLLKREKVPADTISSGSEFQIFITRLINENFVASILHMSDRILKAWPRVVLYWQNLMQFKRSVLANPCRILYIRHKSKIMRRRSRVGSPRIFRRMRYRWFRTAGLDLVNLLCTDSIFSTRYYIENRKQFWEYHLLLCLQRTSEIQLLVSSVTICDWVKLMWHNYATERL